MQRASFSDQQIEETVRLVDTGAPLAEVVSRLGISEATFFAWKTRVERHGAREIRRLRDENVRLTQLVIDLSNDRDIRRTCALVTQPHRRNLSEALNALPVRASLWS